MRALISLIAGVYALAMLVYLLLRALLGDSPWWLAFLNNFTPYYFLPGAGLMLVVLVFRARRGILLLLPVLLIGLVWYGPRFMPKVNAAGDAPTLKIITFNLLWENKEMDALEMWLREQDADIVLLQEVNESQFRRMRTVYPYHSERVVGSYAFGQMILSRYPLSRPEPVVSPYSSGHVPALRVIADVDGQEIAVYNVHLMMPVGRVKHFTFGPANPFVNLLRYYDPAPRDSELGAVLDRAAQETVPVIMGGDFNLSDHAVAYGRIAGQLRDSAREAASGLMATWPVSQHNSQPNFIPPLIRIDYVWHSADFQASSAALGAVLGSDHLPVVVGLVVSR